jgi:hypothetical protein
VARSDRDLVASGRPGSIGQRIRIPTTVATHEFVANGAPGPEIGAWYSPDE